MGETFRAPPGDGCFGHLPRGNLWPPHPASEPQGSAAQASGDLRLPGPAPVTCTRVLWKELLRILQGQEGNSVGLQRASASAQPPHSLPQRLWTLLSARLSPEPVMTGQSTKLCFRAAAQECGLSLLTLATSWQLYGFFLGLGIRGAGMELWPLLCTFFGSPLLQIHNL